MADILGNSRNGVNVVAFLTFLQDRSEGWTATVTLGSTNEGRGVDLAIFAGILGCTPPVGCSGMRDDRRLTRAVAAAGAVFRDQS